MIFNNRYIDKQELDITCPYCNNIIQIQCPETLGLPKEIECLPYTRDMGRFDPPPDRDPNSKESWSTIGKDFFSWINWESIGILRIYDDLAKVEYRVQKCTLCGNLFDVYANYSDRTLGKIWPHIFEKVIHKKDSFKLYEGNSLITLFVNKITCLVGNDVVSVIMVGFMAYLISIAFFLSNLIPYKWDFIQTSFYFMLFLKGVAILGAVISIIFINRYIKFIGENDEMEGLFSNLSERGYIYWRNFTLCRLIGVQSKGLFPKPTQYEHIIVGLTIVFIGITSTLSQSKNGNIFPPIFCLLCILVFFCIIQLWINRNEANYYVKILMGIVASSIVLFIASFQWLEMNITLKWHSVTLIFDIFFWSAILCILGSSLWIGFNSTEYILRSLVTIPLNLNPFSGFNKFQIIRKIHNFSLILVFCFCITLTVVSTVLSILITAHTNNEYLYNPTWIIYFLVLVVGGTLIVLSVATDRKFLFLLTLIFLLVCYGFKWLNVNIENVVIDGRIVIIALFFTSILIYHFLITDNILRKSVKKKKEYAIQILGSEIDRISLQLITNISLKKMDQFEYLSKLMGILNTLECRTFMPSPLKLVVNMIGPLTSAVLSRIIVIKIIN